MSLPVSNTTHNVIYKNAVGFAADNELFFHGFFTKNGGVSEGIYASLNCGVGSNDAPDAVQANRSIVAQTCGVNLENLLGLHQIHSAECIVVKSLWSQEEKPQADSMVTDRSGIALGVLTADCAPVLLYGEKECGAPIIGAAHAGWGGALKGVLGNTVVGMKSLGAEPNSITAAIGPCIGQSSYEVSEGFSAPFLEQSEDNERFFKAARKEGHLMFDLAGYCAYRLAEAGVHKVAMMDLDTYTNEQDFFSYRRKTHRGEEDYGRQISVIMIRP